LNGSGFGLIYHVLGLGLGLGLALDGQVLSLGLGLGLCFLDSSTVIYRFFMMRHSLVFVFTYSPTVLETFADGV